MRWLPGPVGRLTLLLLGFVLSVGIAWWGEHDSSDFDPMPEYRILEREELAWPSDAPSSWPAPDDGIEYVWLLSDSTSYAFHQADDPQMPLWEYTASVSRAGFPLRCIRSVHVSYDSDPNTDRPDRYETNYRYSIASFDQDWLIHGLGLPYGPVISYGIEPIGMALNTTFYAVLLWIPILPARWFRFHQRIKTNRCAGCAYDVQGVNQCSECGHAVPTPKIRNTSASVN